MKIIDLTKPIFSGMEVYPGDPVVKIKQIHFLKNIGLAFKSGKLDIELLDKIKDSKPLFVVVGNQAEIDTDLENKLLKTGILTITDLVNMD